jgi:Zn-dependent M28 family amino/carboxypeptidase
LIGFAASTMITNDRDAIVVTAAKSFSVSKGRLLNMYGAEAMVELAGVMRMV